MATHDRSDGMDGLKCSHCGCQFLDRSTYESHVKIHTSVAGREGRGLGNLVAEVTHPEDC